MKNIILVTIALLVAVFSGLPKLVAEQKEMKLLVLIISSDNFPGSNLVFPYKELQKVWSSYMHLDPEHIEAYFIRGNPELTAEFEVVDDVVWCKTEENVIPGILNKTIMSMEYLLPRIDEFDFILRTNLSSFYVFPRLLEFLKTIPKTGCYCASGEGFGSGCGFLLSSDIVKLLVENKNHLFNNSINDDVAIGYFLRDKGIKLYPAPRIDFLSLEDWFNYRDKITSNDFHFRVKNLKHELRATEDLFIYSELLDVFYK